MNKSETLAKAYNLVNSGNHSDAIDLLLKYTETVPDPQDSLHNLGQAYILEGQPDQATIYLNRTLAILRADNCSYEIAQDYHSESFSDNDMAFVESQAEKLAEEHFDFELHDNVSGSSRGSKSDLAPSAVIESELTTHQNTNNDSKIDNVGRLTPLQDKSYIANDSPNVATANEVVNPTDADATQLSDQQSNESNFSSKKLLLLNSSLENATATQEEGVFEELGHKDSLGLTDEPEELLWDEFEDFEDLEDFNELANRAFDQVRHDGTISREARAKQVAVSVLEKWGWDAEHLPLLQQIFEENGWSRARVSIEEQIEYGIRPEELALARRVRRLWLSTDQFWTTFQFIGGNDSFRQTSARYKSISWHETVRIIRCFPSFPEIEEIYWFIDEVFEHWYNSDSLKKLYPAFLMFLKYRVEAIHESLPGESAFSFLYYFDPSSDGDADRVDNYLFDEGQEQRLLMGLDGLL